MKTVYIWAIGLAMLVCNSIGATVRQRLYVQTVDTIGGTDISSTHSESFFDCATLCSTEPLCRRYSYNVNDKKCWMSRDKLRQETTGGVVYMRQCPTLRGFVTHQLGNETRCLKDVNNDAPYATALAKCASQDAHLFLVESADDLHYLYINGMMAAWIDGGADATTWYGEPLPWLPWGPTFPRDNQCVYGLALPNRFETSPCSTVDDFVCQIDV